MATREYNFDGLIGPTHNYAGLSRGNLASQSHRNLVSNPREAALQGLAKMKFLADLGIGQAIIPPLERPDLATLRRLGFSGSDEQVIERVAKQSPALLAACYGASSMWTANAATVSPSSDTGDGKIHFTPANLVSQFHRSLEPPGTAKILRAIFADESRFVHHDPLPGHPNFGDEGAANHMRVGAHSSADVEMFVHGRSSADAAGEGPHRFPARQSRQASEAIARLHRLNPSRTIYLGQNPAAIDGGAFHNDVVAVSNENVLIYHGSAFNESNRFGPALLEHCDPEGRLELIEVSANELSLEDAVHSYLFNSQLVTLSSGGMALICPIESRETPAARQFLDRLLEKRTAIHAVYFVDLRQSMNNGGGPACLRLRVVLTEAERAAAAPGFFLTDALHEALTAWVKRHYRDRLHPHDLADPRFIPEVRAALDELSKILGLKGRIYPFQQ